MEQIKPFSDQRLDKMCSYCGDLPETRDHVPSRILLDEPYPENLPVVPCCLKCNLELSADEEYFACAIECLIHGTTEIQKLRRDKIKTILIRKELLRQSLRKAFIQEKGEIRFKIDSDRFKKVIIKLAKGHVKYENSEPMLKIPTTIWIKPIISMTELELDHFFKETEIDKAAEVGSRALSQMLINANKTPISHWTIVQENNYQYSVEVSLGRVNVKILIWNYLAIVVSWL